MISAICTLFEGDYHYGVGALANSLYNNGFRGEIWAGYRGTLPTWANPLKQGQGYQEFYIGKDCSIRFVKLNTPYHLTNYKPTFMWELWENYCPDAEALFYFDPDIINKCHWSFYEEWVNRGIALCEDIYYNVPVNHPRRLAWQEFAELKGYPLKKELNRFYNAGFVGLKQSYKSICLIWQQLIDMCIADGYLDAGVIRSENIYPYLVDDQCVLNLTLMLTSEPLSTVGCEGMDFLLPGNIMSHAAQPGGKPWRKKALLQALNGVPPTLSDKAYWQQTQIPIQLYSRWQHFWKKLELLSGAAVGRFIRRAPA